MNRSLLLVVCDFLLLSLLGLADFERSGQPVTGEDNVRAIETTSTPEPDNAMMDLLASALAAEQTSQVELQEELSRAKEELSALESSKEALSESLEEKTQAMAEREKQLAEAREDAKRVAEEKAAAEERAAAIQEERDRIAAERQTAADEAKQLSATVDELASRANTSEEELQRRSAELARLESELAERTQKLAEAERRRDEVETDRIRLVNEVATAEREKLLLSSTLQSARETINVERREKEQLRQQTESLTEGVTRLADASTEITAEVKKLRPKTTNEIFQNVKANQVRIQFEGANAGIFSENSFSESVETVLTEVNGRVFLWVQLSQTPFADPDRRRFINSLDVFLQAGDTRFRVPQLGILRDEKTLLFLPLSEEIVGRLGVEIFPTSQTPFRFEDMVVIDLPDTRYGESSFRINTRKPGYLEIDSRVFSALFGEFSPSAGDLAFTRTGEFLGIVTKAGEAWMVESVNTGGKIDFGEKFTRSQLNQLP